MLAAILVAILSVSGGVLASELLSRIVTPFPKLIKYSDAVKACESKGMQLAQFESRENIQYTLKLMVDNNFDRAWIGGIGEDKRQQLIIEVFDGSPILFNISQVNDREKMLPALCSFKEDGDETSLVESAEKLTIEQVEQTKESDDEKVEIEQKAVEEDETELSSEQVILKFTETSEDVIVTQESNGIEQVKESENDFDDENGIDGIKSKGGKNRCKSKKKKKRCRRKKKNSCRRRLNCSSSSSDCSSSSSSCSDPSSSSSSSSSSCSSSNNTSCNSAPSRYCDPFEPSGSSTSSSSSSSSSSEESKCHKKRKGRRHISSSSSSSDSSRSGCNTGLCGSRGGKFFREIRISKHIN